MKHPGIEMAETKRDAGADRAEHLLSLLSEPQRELVEQRRSVCSPCIQNQKLSVVSVKCEACGCAGVSLIHGKCKLRKWPSPTRDSEGRSIEMPPRPTPPPEPPAWTRETAIPHATYITTDNSAIQDITQSGIYVYGFPGEYAGGNTELHHQIILWKAMGLDVHLIPGSTGYKRESLYLEMIERGVVVHESNDFEAIPPGTCVLAFCNGSYLNRLDNILKHSHNTIFINCMTWLFETEKLRHRQGKIAAFLYQNGDVCTKSSAALREINPDPGVRYLTFRPYFHAEAFPFIDPAQRDTDGQDHCFTIGRISREDADKYAADTLNIWESIQTPGAKSGLMLGFGPASKEKIGTPPSWVKTYSNQRELTQQSFYRSADVVVQPMDTTENWPRIGLEAMASGSVLIVDNRGGWKRMVEHGVTGWLCDSSDDFVRYATRMAHEPEERGEIARSARARLDDLAGYEASSVSWRSVLEEIGLSHTRDSNAIRVGKN